VDGGRPKHHLCAFGGARTRENTIINRVRSMPRAVRSIPRAVDLPEEEEKCGYGSCLNQRDRATCGFVRVRSHGRPGKKIGVRGFLIALASPLFISAFRAGRPSTRPSTHAECMAEWNIRMHVTRERALRPALAGAGRRADVGRPNGIRGARDEHETRHTRAFRPSVA